MIKILLIRFALLTSYFLAALLNLTLLPMGYDLWGCALSVAFAFAATYFTGRATIFVLLSVFIATCVAPIMALGTVAQSLHGSYFDSCIDIVAKMITYNPFHGLELLLPMLSAAALLVLMQRWKKRHNERHA